MLHESPVWRSIEEAVWRHLIFTSSPHDLQVHVCSFQPSMLSDSASRDAGGMRKRMPGERGWKRKTGRVDSWRTNVQLIRVKLHGGVWAHIAPTSTRAWHTMKFSSMHVLVAQFWCADTQAWWQWQTRWIFNELSLLFSLSCIVDFFWNDCWRLYACKTY